MSILDVALSLVHEHRKAAHRSDRWPVVRRAYLQAYPTCAACGGTTLLQVHHVIPVFEDPALELNAANLLTLCAWRLCHLRFGHAGSFDWHVPNVRGIADAVLAGRMTRDEAYAVAIHSKKRNGPWS